jgi:hypothetical protein
MKIRFLDGLIIEIAPEYEELIKSFITINLQIHQCHEMLLDDLIERQIQVDLMIKRKVIVGKIFDLKSFPVTVWPHTKLEIVEDENN